MAFNGAPFCLFLGIVLVLYVALKSTIRSVLPQKLMLLAASLFFYGSWDHRYLSLLILSCAFDYQCGLCIAQRPPPRLHSILLFVAVAVAQLLSLAPIDWDAIGTSLRPTWAYSGGFGTPAPTTRLLVPEGSWRQATAALVALGVGTALIGLGHALRRELRPKYFLALSVTASLTLLGFFKYYDFFVCGIERLIGGHGWTLGIIVPIGISFYTFQTLSYTIDVYRGEQAPTTSFLDFSLFVSFFPQLVAGPIERAKSLLPQLQASRPYDRAQIQTGAFLIGWGLFKKIFVADNLAGLVDPVFAPGRLAATGPEILLASYAFAFQVYADFSGYSDIARGAARLLGVELGVNFRIPYAARNPRELWSRWHISLSTFLRDYLFLPLCGTEGGSRLFYARNLMITAALGGLWHGARANFVLWGLFNGALLCAHYAAEPLLKRCTPQGDLARRAFHLACWVAFFQLRSYGSLLFRAGTLDQVLAFTSSLGTGWGAALRHVEALAQIAWFCGPLFIVEIIQHRTGNLLAPLCWPWPVRAVFYLLIFYLTVAFGAIRASEFIYFQF